MAIPSSIRPSRILSKLRAGKVAGCTKFNLADPRAIEVACLCGIECVWLDLEHCPNSIHDIENQIRAAKAYNVDAIVRVRRGSYSDLVVPLEMDAAGIMVPHLMSAADARLVARQTKFHPIGRRPLDGGNADGAYCLVDGNQYMTEANAQRIVIVQIEDPEPLAELDEIAATPGIDMLFFGPGDFAHGIGKPGQFADAQIEDARVRVAQAAQKAGKLAGTVATIESMPRMVSLGYTFLNLGADVLGLSDYYKQIAAAFGSVAEIKQASGVYRA
jgi:4-hydroxy-2-oxoheptanedioate aldolase